MNPKNISYLALLLLVGVAAWIIIDFVRLGHLTASPVRTGVLIIAALILLYVRRRRAA